MTAATARQDDRETQEPETDGDAALTDMTGQPEIRPVSTDTVFFHGTRAPEFDVPLPGTCFTTVPNVAIHFAWMGGYQAMGKENTGPERVLTARLDLPGGSVFIPSSQIFRECLSMLENSKNRSQEDAWQNARDIRDLRAAYHREATAIAREMGMNAYHADMFRNPDEDALVLLEPERATITCHNVRDMLATPTGTEITPVTPQEQAACAELLQAGEIQEAGTNLYIRT